MSILSLLLLFLLLLPPLSSSFPPNATTIPQSELAALLSLKLSLHDPIRSLSSWSPLSPPCSTWRGVACSPSGHVAALRLPHLLLSGSLPPSALSALPFLSKLSLHSNSLSGPVPDLSNLSSLHVLNLAGNHFSGPIPSSSLPLNLCALDLSSNSLSGPVPASFPSSLHLFNRSFNRLLASSLPPSPSSSTSASSFSTGTAYVARSRPSSPTAPPCSKSPSKGMPFRGPTARSRLSRCCP